MWALFFLLPALASAENFCQQFNWDNGIHPHPYNCVQFVECTYGVTAVMNCPTSLLYSPQMQTCQFPDLMPPCDKIPPTSGTRPTVVTATTKPTYSTATVVAVHANFCKILNFADGLYPDPTDCRRYLECGLGQTTLRICHGNMVFDPSSLKCTDQKVDGCP